MSETHTPGPWSVEECHLDFRKFNLGDYMILSENRIVPCLVWGGAGWSQGRANARLIAAAPELLAYAEHMASIGDPDAIELVAKATGRQLTAEESQP